MFGQTTHGGQRYYRHSNAEHDRTCPGPTTKAWIRADEVEDLVMRHLFETFGNPTAVQHAIEAATPKDDRIKQALERQEKISGELGKVKSSIQRVVGLVAKGTIVEEDATEQLGKLKERQQKLDAEQARLSDELAHIPSGGKNSRRVQENCWPTAGIRQCQAGCKHSARQPCLRRNDLRGATEALRDDLQR